MGDYGFCVDGDGIKESEDQCTSTRDSWQTPPLSGLSTPWVAMVSSVRIRPTTTSSSSAPPPRVIRTRMGSSTNWTTSACTSHSLGSKNLTLDVSQVSQVTTVSGSAPVLVLMLTLMVILSVVSTPEKVAKRVLLLPTSRRPSVSSDFKYIKHWSCLGPVVSSQMIFISLSYMGI